MSASHVEVNVCVCSQASLATVHNLWIAVLIGGLLTGFLWYNAPLLIQGARRRSPNTRPSPVIRESRAMKRCWHTILSESTRREGPLASLLTTGTLLSCAMTLPETSHSS